MRDTIGIEICEGGLPTKLKGNAPFRITSSAASDNASNISTTAGIIDGVKGKNTAAYAILVSFFNDDNSDSLPTDDNLIEVLEFPAGQISFYDFPAGIACSNGIGVKLTKASDGSAVAAGDVSNLSVYYRA